MSVVELPKYEQIKRSLIREIEQGRWSAGSAVPSEAQLVQRFGVSRPTLVRSLQDLVRDGYLYRRQGKGTFVADRRRAERAERPDGEPVPATLHAVPVFISNYTAALSGDAREVLLRILRGMQAALAGRQLDLVLRNTPVGDLDDDTRRFLEQTEPGPALVIEPSFNPALWRKLQQDRWDVWGVNEPVSDGDCVYIDQEHAGYLATKYLLDHGRRRVALLNGPIADYWGFEARLSGYRRALREAGIEFDPALAREGVHVVDSEAGRAMMRAVLNETRGGVPVDGVVGASDSKAIGAMAAAEDAGIQVPQQIAFVSIDNTLAERTAGTSKPLPAVAMPFEEVGRRAASLALEAKSESGSGIPYHEQIQLKPTLVER